MKPGKINEHADLPEAHNSIESELELEQELKQKLNLSSAATAEEKSHAVVDFLRLQFVDIVKQLDSLALAATNEEKRAASKRVRSWLASLNSGPLVPLSFRLRHLRDLEDYLDLLAEDMGGLLLRAYKIAMLEVQRKALENEAYYKEIVHVGSVALDLACRQLKRDALRYFDFSILEIRQSLDIARLALVVSKKLPQCHHQFIEKLKHNLIQHELLRRIDFAALPVEEQRRVFALLPHYASMADVEYVAKGETLHNWGQGPFLVTLVGRPDMRPKRRTIFPRQMESAVFAIRMTKMIRQATEDRERAREIEDVTTRGFEELLTENEVAEAKSCSSALLQMMRRVKREKRTVVEKKEVGVRIHVGIDVPDVSGDWEPIPAEANWQVYDLSRKGAKLICESKDGKVFTVGSILSVEWPVKTGWPRYALVRWMQVSPQGYKRLGIEFIRGDIKGAKVSLVNVRTASIGGGEWPALLEKVPSGWFVWLGSDKNYHTPITVSIESDGNSNNICRLYPLENRGGDNFSMFNITEVLTISELKAMALTYGQDEEKKSPDQLKF